MTVPNSADSDDGDDLGFSMIPIWLLRDGRLPARHKLLYVVLASYQSGPRTPYTRALEDNAMMLVGLSGAAYDDAVKRLEAIGVLRIEAEEAGNMYLLGTYEGAL